MKLFSQFNYRKFRSPRLWSNHELKKIAHLFDGEVINVSGWDDRDKEGGYYANYFYRARKYYLSNYRGVRGLDEAGDKTDFEIDLEADLPDSLINRFDVVFNHTCLEHIYDVFKSFRNLCLMTKDILIIVVPFTQQVHTSKSFSDFWRFTPHVIERLFSENAMTLIYLNFNNNYNCSNYIFAIGSRNPQKWYSKIPQIKNTDILSDWIGEPRWYHFVKKKFLISYALRSANNLFSRF